MKRIARLLLCMLTIITALWTHVAVVQAEDAGYVYKELNVYIDVNEKREYQVREVMRIDFEEEMHGILRDIPTFSSVEKFEVDNIQVEGMPFTVEEWQDRVDVKIGDANSLVKGEKEITLSYTLKHYQDYDHLYDYIYVNALGTNYDTQIENFHGEITFPSPEALLDYRVTSGRAGDTGNSYVRASLEGNRLLMDSKKSIPAYRGVSAQLKLTEGVFAQAPVYPYPYIIKDNHLRVEINEEQDFLITQTVTFQGEGRLQMYLPTIHENWDSSEYEIEELDIPEDPHVILREDSISVNASANERTVTFSYKVHPYQLMKDSLTFTLNELDEDTKIEHFTMELMAPQDIEGSIEIKRGSDSTREDRYRIIATSNAMHLETTEAIEAGEQFTFTFPLADGSYHREQGGYVQIALILSVVLAGLCLLLRFVIFRNVKPITPVNFYPPKGMNSAEAGYIIDLKLSDSDLTSLIFYWADKGYLKIHNVQKEYSFERIKDVDSFAPAYEKRLFQTMFSHGRDGIVKKEDLRFTFYQDIRIARKEIQALYQGKHAQRSQVVEAIRKLFMGLSILPFLYYLVAGTLYHYPSGTSTIFICVLYIPIFLMVMSLLRTSFQPVPAGRQGRASRIVNCIMAAVLLLILVKLSKVELSLVFWLCLVCSLLVLWCASGMHKDSAYRRELLAPLLGFQDFILHAEKNRLEMLLEEDPEYFYHVLPYAQVLHVSQLWSQKFTELLVVPAKWYVGDEAFHYQDFLMCMQRIERDMHSVTRAPASSSRSGGSSSSNHSGYSGGGDSFSSGGSTGGGSGGGGSRGW